MTTFVHSYRFYDHKIHILMSGIRNKQIAEIIQFKLNFHITVISFQNLVVG